MRDVSLHYGGRAKGGKHEALEASPPDDVIEEIDAQELNRVFVRMLKDEFFKLAHVEGYDNEQAQVLHDLYGLDCFLDSSYELIEHHCVHDAFLDKNVAMQTVDLLLSQASKITMKDLVKHPLKDTIEKVHGVISKKKPTEAILQNRDIYRAFLRSPINPIDLYGSLKGQGNRLPVTSIPTEDATTEVTAVLGVPS